MARRTVRHASTRANAAWGESPIRQPGSVGKHAQQFLESPGEFDEHLSIYLALLIRQGNSNRQAGDEECSELSKLHSGITRHVIHPSPKERAIQLEFCLIQQIALDEALVR